MPKLSLWSICVAVWIVAAPAVHAQPGSPTSPRLGIVFVVNGSGGDMSLTESMHAIVKARCLPLAEQTIAWCRWDQLGKDHRDYLAQVIAAEKLVDAILEYRRCFPTERIFLIGHSAGNHVILAAMRAVPPDTVDRILLLAPSVSQYHDLRPALRASRGGIDSFWSREDQLVSLGADLFGNADRLPGRPPGEVGFTIMPPTTPDAHLYCNLRQPLWNPSWAWTGHTGKHYGFTRQCFVDAYVVPTMLAPLAPR